MNNLSALDTFNTLIIALFRSHQAVNMLGEQLAQPHGLTVARWKVLGAITLAKAPLTVPQIARNMGLTRQAVQRTVDELTKAGHLIQQENPAHKRSSIFSLSDTGSSLFSSINSDWEKAAVLILKELDQQAVCKMSEGLEQLYQLTHKE